MGELAPTARVPRGGRAPDPWEYVGKGDKEAVCLLNGLAMHTRAWFGIPPAS